MSSVQLDVPPHSNELKVSFPADHVLLLSMNRPKALNAMSRQMEEDIKIVLNWFDEQVSLWVCIVTGEGRMFCAGADLKEWNRRQQNNIKERMLSVVHGFGSISRRRTSCKPMIAAVNGGAYGGGLEMVLNCDIVIASEKAQFAAPEVKRGVVAIQGAIPRLAKIAGHQLASELLLLGSTIDAKEAQTRFRFVNIVVPPSDLLPAAIRVAQQITQNSPDAVQSTKRALQLSQSHGFEDTVQIHVSSDESKRVYTGANIKEGLKAFTEKRLPLWKNPAKL
jgi:enoyl-CoA hydratase/carnithine racemase